MSTADNHEWYVTVPNDDTELAAELVAELHRQGLKPGQRVRLSVTRYAAETDPDHELHAPQRRHLSFVGSISAEPDLSEGVDEYLRQGFGQE